MVLQRWDPFRDMLRMERSMDRMWRGFRGHDGASVSMGTLPLDVLERGEDIVIRASLPGMDPKDINATLEGNVLTIKGPDGGRDRASGCRLPPAGAAHRRLLSQPPPSQHRGRRQGLHSLRGRSPDRHLPQAGGQESQAAEGGRRLERQAPIQTQGAPDGPGRLVLCCALSPSR